MRKFAGLLLAIGILAAGPLASGKAESFGQPAMRADAESTNPVQNAACREKRQGWHGFGWYPCKEPANTCEKCRWRWGYKYCWKTC
jgi:hypothetical protein